MQAHRMTLSWPDQTAASPSSLRNHAVAVPQAPVDHRPRPPSHRPPPAAPSCFTAAPSPQGWGLEATSAEPEVGGRPASPGLSSLRPSPRSLQVPGLSFSSPNLFHLFHQGLLESSPGTLTGPPTSLCRQQSHIPSQHRGAWAGGPRRQPRCDSHCYMSSPDGVL